MAIGLGVHASNAATSNTVLATPSRTSQVSGSSFWGAQFTSSADSSRSVADSKSNVYTIIGSAVAGNAGSTNLRHYYKENGVGGSGHTFTSTSNQAIGPSVFFCEITGGKLAGVLHTSNQGQDSTSPYGDSLPVTLTANGLILAVLLGSSESTATHAEANGFTIIEDVTDGASFWTGFLAYKIVGPGTYTASMTESVSGASNGPPFAVALAVFEELPVAFIDKQERRPFLVRQNLPLIARNVTRERERTWIGAASVSQITGTAALTFGQTGTLTGAGALSGTATLTFAQSGALLGTGALSGTAALTFSQSGTLTGTGALSGSTTLTFAATGTLDQPTGDISGTSALTFGQSGTLTGLGTLSGTAALTFGQSGALTGFGALSGSTALSFGQSGTLTGTGTLTATAALTFGQTGALTATGTLAGSSSLTFGATGTLDQPTGAASGTATLTFSASGTLTATGALSGSATLTFAATGTMNQPASSGTVIPGLGGGGSIDWQRPKRKRKFKHVDEILEDVVSAYRELSSAPEEVQAKAADLVRPFTDSKKAAVPVPETVDWERFEANAKRVNSLLKLWRSDQERKAIELDDEDWFLLS
jgi:hypothetical protein